MSLKKRIFAFLFGKDPDIFDEKGRVRHNLGEKRWREWESRFHGPEYDWRKHSGMAQPPSTRKRNG